MSQRAKLNNKRRFFYYKNYRGRRVFLRKVLLVGSMIWKAEKKALLPAEINPKRGPPGRLRIQRKSKGRLSFLKELSQKSLAFLRKESE